MKIEELEIGCSYTRDDDAEFLVVYKTKKWALTLRYSHNHMVCNPHFLTQDDLDEPWNKTLHKDEEWNLNEYLDGLKCISEDELKYVDNE